MLIKSDAVRGASSQVVDGGRRDEVLALSSHRFLFTPSTSSNKVSTYSNWGRRKAALKCDNHVVCCTVPIKIHEKRRPIMYSHGHLINSLAWREEGW